MRFKTQNISRWRFFFLPISFILILSILSFSVMAFETIEDKEWNKYAVRKVLHAFAFGGFASDKQIKIWARMEPQKAIQEMLTFDPINDKLSAVELNAVGDPATFDGTLQQLQDYWSSNDPDNPVQERYRRLYALTTLNSADETVLVNRFLQYAWTQAVTTRGVNPFLHNTAFYLTNYHMAISITKTVTALMRNFYDNALLSLSNGSSLFDILAEGATSAALARAYGHQYNRYRNSSNRFYGNDDFAREFHQLLFKIQGATEADINYHEDVTIEHTAWALTGMRIDRVQNAYGTTRSFYWFVPQINFTDHADGVLNADGSTRMLRNFTNHYRVGDGCLEILRATVCGATAEEKIYRLTQVAGYHPESLANIPIAIINYFADDNITDRKKARIQEAWINNDNKDLLSFLQSYAISASFHNSSTVKYRSSFSRNLIIQNANTVDNLENFQRFELPFGQMKKEGAEVFIPAHDVFGGQTGLQAANNPNIFKTAYQRNVLTSNKLARTNRAYIDNAGDRQLWKKDWAKVIPSDEGRYEVKKVAEWLWIRFIGDGKKNLGNYEKAYIHALLAEGKDLGYLIDSTNPDLSYSENDLNSPDIKPLLRANKKALIDLESLDPSIRSRANQRIGLAINFITVTPFMFALEGK